jgi:hypothetical protein
MARIVEASRSLDAARQIGFFVAHWDIENGTNLTSTESLWRGLKMLRPIRRSTLLASAFAPLLSWIVVVSAVAAHAQGISVTRLPIDTDMTVRLTNLTSHVNYDRSGDSYFIVPEGRYSVQLLRGDQIAYQEIEYISGDSPSTRTVNPKRMEIVVGLPNGGPQFDSTLCAALATAAQLAIGNFGLHHAEVQRRLSHSDGGGNLSSCGTIDAVDATARMVSGSYGVTALGMVGLSIEYTPIGPQVRPRNRGNSPIYTNPATQRISPAQQPNANLTPALIRDLKSGTSAVAIDSTGRPLLVCAAIDANTPVFCDANGLAVSTPAIADLRAIYRLNVKASPVDHYGVELDHWTTFVGDDEYRATQQKLSNDVTTMQANLTARIAQLQANSVTAPSRNDPQISVRYYSTPDLQALIVITQTEIDQALQNSALQPLRRHFPRPLSQIDKPDQPATRGEEAEKVFADLKNNLGVLASTAGGLGIDFVFRTTPVETEGARLSIDACDRCTPMLSQAGQHRFYRGRYYVHVSLDGYVPYEGWVDLVEDPRTILECDMARVRRSSSGRASTCSLKAQ